MATLADLQPLVASPREEMAVEHKTWLDLTTNEHRAIVAKAAIALINHGGGYIVIGMDEVGGALQSIARPAAIPEVTQDAVNSAIQRYAEPAFHVETHNVPHPVTGVIHPVVVVPGTLTVPVMSKRDCPGVLAQNRCYIRKPGPRSEEAQSAGEWRELLNRCLRAGRDDMLEAIRAIVAGRVATPAAAPDAEAAFEAFINNARQRWEALVADLPADAPSRFPVGHYEMAFGLVGGTPAASLNELRAKLQAARRIKLTGWTPFLEMHTAGWEPYAHDDFIEAWVGNPIRENLNPAHCDFWRASRDGKLFTMRGYSEDGHDPVPPGQVIDVTLPVWRIGEGLLFAARVAEQDNAVSQIAIRCRFTGLRNRRLTSVDGRRILMEGYVSRTEEVTLNAAATPEQVRDNLSEIVHRLLIPLYERFSFFELPFQLVDEELARMRQGRF